QGETLSFTADAESSAGGLVAVDAATGNYTYTPPTDFSGTDYFCFTVSDASRHTSPPATLTTPVNYVQQAPTVAYGSKSTDGNVPSFPTRRSSDLQGETLSFTADAESSAGGLVAVDAATGLYTYTPPTDFSGTDYFCFTVSDAS